MKKTFIWTLLGLASLVFISLAFLPSFLSTPLGKDIILSYVNKNTLGRVEFKNIHLSWLGSQKIEGFSLKDPHGEEIGSFEQLSTKSSLLYLLFGGRSLKELSLNSPHFVVNEQDEKGNGQPRPASEKKKPFLKGEIGLPFLHAKSAFIENGTLIFEKVGSQPIVITDIHLAKERSAKAFSLTAKSKQNLLEGAISLEVNYEKKGEIHTDIHNFPVLFLDHIFSSSFFSESIGNTLNASLDIREEKNSFILDARLNSSHLSALLKGESVGNTLHLNPESSLTLSVNPSFFNQLEISRNHKWALASKTDLLFKVQKGMIPLDFENFNLKDVVFQAVANLDRAELHHETAGSYSLNHFEISVGADQNLELGYKGEIRGKEATEVTGTFSLAPDNKILFNSVVKGVPTSLIELFFPELADHLELLFGKNIDFSTYGTYLDHTLDAHYTLDSKTAQLKGNVDGKGPDFSFDLDGNALLSGEKAKWLGKLVDISMKGDLHLEENSFAIPTLCGHLSNSQFDAHFKGNFGKPGERLCWELVQLEAGGSIQKLLNLEGYPINNGSFGFKLDGSKGHLAASVQGSFSNSLSEMHFEMKDFLTENSFDPEKAKGVFEFKLGQLPTMVLDPFLPDDCQLISLVGDSIDLNGSGKLCFGENAHTSIELEAKGEGLSSYFSFDVDQTFKISLNKPAHIHWEMSPERYDSLMDMLDTEGQESMYLLVKQAPVDLIIQKLELPSLDPENLKGFLSQSGLEADLLLGTLIFKQKETNETFIVQDISGSVKGEKMCQSAHVSVAGNLSSPQIPHAQHSAFSLKGQILNMATPQGKFDHEKMTFKGELNLDLLPVKQLTEVLPLDDVSRTNIQAILGELVNARISGEISHMTGPLNVDVKASNFKALLPLQLTRDAIYLRDYVDAEITLTDAVNEALIKDINPIMITGAYSDHPIKIYIEPNGFMLPIRPFSLQGLKIDRAIVNIGKIRVRNGGQIQSLMEFIKAKDVADDHTMDAWFTPIIMSLRNGVASYKRFDMLLGSSVHIALWGDINLINDHVNMILGIAPSTLKTRFNVGVTKKDLFQVPMRGTTTKLDLDWSSASTRIAALIARSKGGPAYIIGSIIEKFMGEEISPPPSTVPFPWEHAGLHAI